MFFCETTTRVWETGSGAVSEDCQGTGYCHTFAKSLSLCRRESRGTNALLGWWQTGHEYPSLQTHSRGSANAWHRLGRRKPTQATRSLHVPFPQCLTEGRVFPGAVRGNTTLGSCKKRQVPGWVWALYRGLGGDSTAGCRGDWRLQRDQET